MAGGPVRALIYDRRMDAQQDSIRDEFSRQADDFARSPAMTAAATLGALVELVPPQEGARWLEVACGPGIVSRALAPRVGSVQGVDLTPSMVEKARAEAEAAGVDGVEFSLGDATALDFDDGAFDGAITRFSLHHIPVPGRVLAEMARVVRPGGLVVVSDHLTDEDGDAAAWHGEVERLRDPSHWASLTPARIRELGAAAGLELDREEILPFDIDYDEWLYRGSAGATSSDLIERLLAEAPAGVESFRVFDSEQGRRLGLRNSLTRWRVV
jgi:SAM-dependent methyltransferase